MKAILLNGLLASGKTTVGKLLVEKLINNGQSAKFIDLDDEVERINGSHEFDSPEKKKEVWLSVRKNVAEITNLNMQKGIVTVIGGPFFQKDEIDGFIEHLDPKAKAYLYTLSAPLDIRLGRNRQREWPNPDEDVHLQYQRSKELDEHFGEDLQNIGTTREIVDKILQFIREGLGRIK